MVDDPDNNAGPVSPTDIVSVVRNGAAFNAEAKDIAALAPVPSTTTPVANPLDPAGIIGITQNGTLYRTDPQSILNIGTITTASAAVGSNANGVSVVNLAGDGDGPGGGGSVYSTGGHGGASGYGGNSIHEGGIGGTYGGIAGLYGGNGGLSGGGVYLNTGSGLNPGAPGGTLSITLGLPGSAGMARGTIRVDGDPSLPHAEKSWFATEPLNGRTIYTATRAELVTAVIGRVDAANGGAATLVVVKCPPLTAPGAGTPLTSDSMDLAGTPTANQTLTLSVTAADLLLAAGDSLCLVETGVLGTSVGCITVHTTPQ